MVGASTGFGGALAGTTSAYLQFLLPGILVSGAASLRDVLLAPTTLLPYRRR